MSRFGTVDEFTLPRAGPMTDLYDFVSTMAPIIANAWFTRAGMWSGKKERKRRMH